MVHLISINHPRTGRGYGFEQTGPRTWRVLNNRGNRPISAHRVEVAVAAAKRREQRDPWNTWVYDSEEAES